MDNYGIAVLFIITMVVIAQAWLAVRGQKEGTDRARNTGREWLVEITVERARINELQREFKSLAEYVESRVEDGNKVWRRIRASQRREEESVDGEDPEQLHILDGGGGEGEGVPGMHTDMGTDAERLLQVQRSIIHQQTG